MSPHVPFFNFFPFLGGEEIPHLHFFPSFPQVSLAQRSTPSRQPPCSCRAELPKVPSAPPRPSPALREPVLLLVNSASPVRAGLRRCLLQAVFRDFARLGWGLCSGFPGSSVLSFSRVLVTVSWVCVCFSARPCSLKSGALSLLHLTSELAQACHTAVQFLFPPFLPSLVSPGTGKHTACLQKESQETL